VLDEVAKVASDNHPIIRWLMTDGRRIVGSNEFLEELAQCLRRTGIDVTRITTGVPILHPQIFSFSGLWQLGKGASERLYRADGNQSGVLENSPIKIACLAAILASDADARGRGRHTKPPLRP